MPVVLRYFRGACLTAFACVALAGPARIGSHALAADKKQASDVKVEPIAIAEAPHEGPVNFEKEILPVLSKKCLACHNATNHESQLSLETPATILKGGESGAAVQPKNAAASLLLLAASRQGDVVMPPPDNDVGATPFTPAELGILKRWIDEGATGEVGQQLTPMHWQPLPPGINPVYAVALSEDGQWAACSRANQIFIYHLPSGRLVTRLTDPRLTGEGQPAGVAHVELVHSLRFSPDGGLLASGGFREIKLWRRPQNVRNFELANLPEPATSLAASRDGRWLATGHASGAIKLWAADNGHEAKTLSGHTGPVTALQFLGDNQRLASGSADKTLRVWKLDDGSIAAQKELPLPITALAVTSDDKQIAAAGTDKLLQVWKLEGDELRAIDSGSPISALAAAPDDASRIFSGHADNAIRQWNLGNDQRTRQIDQGGAVTALAVRGDGQQLASAGANHLVKLWRVGDGQPWPGINNQPIPPMLGDLSAKLAAGRQERLVAAQTAKVALLKQAAVDAESQAKAAVEAIKSANDAKESAVKNLAQKQEAAKAPVEAKAKADKDLEVARVERETAEQAADAAKQAAEQDAQNADLAKARDEARKRSDEAIQRFKKAENVAKEAAGPAAKAMQELLGAEAASLAADGAATTAVTTSQKAAEAVPLAQAAQRDAEATLVARQSELEAANQVVKSHEAPLRALVYSPDGQTLVSGGDQRTIVFWNAENGVPLDAITAQPASVTGLAFAAGGLFAASPEKSVIAWNPASDWRLERTIGDPDSASLLVDRVLALDFNPDGKLLASGGGEPTRSGELKFWNVADGSLARAISPAHSDTIFAVEFSPSGELLATGGADRMMKIFEVATGSLVRTFEGHTHHVLGVAWRWDGKSLATCGADDAIKIWDAASGDQTRQQFNSSKEVTAIHFLPLSSKVLAACGDRTVRLFETNPNGGNERTFGGPSDFLYALAVSGDGKVLVAAGQDSSLWQWNIENGQMLHKFEPPDRQTGTNK